MVDPRNLCNQHLLGEHGEIHKHRHNFEKHHSIKGRIYPITKIEPINMEIRHNRLAEEMLRREMKHKSPFIQPDISYLPKDQIYAKVDVEVSRDDLISRCDKCYKKERFEYL
jgi:hypothetical protein